MAGRLLAQLLHHSRLQSGQVEALCSSTARWLCCRHCSSKSQPGSEWGTLGGVPRASEQAASAAHAQQAYHSSTAGASSNAQARGSASAGSSSSGSSGGSITASCDVPPGHVLHTFDRARNRALAAGGSHDGGSGSGGGSSGGGSAGGDGGWHAASFGLPSRIESGTLPPDDFYEGDQVLSTFYEEGTHGGLGRRFRRKVPLFQVRGGVRCPG
jgi:hypothetical protein